MIVAYLRERFPGTFFGPVALMLAACALGRSASVVELGIGTIGAAFLLAQFRIWDDLADRRKDAIAHPQRVLVTAKDPTPLVTLAMALLAINGVAAVNRDGTLLSVLLLALVHAALGGYYLLRNGRTVLGDQLLLAKYPAFIFILAGERLISSPLHVALTASAVYAAASAYEAWHDPISPLAQLLGGRS
ncbi:MAG: hypothetical protein M3541_16070 [Acidobacteriota bacterium]|nr:hypothetical protein [Acidobacteriota bacterium]MDQ3420264.1 hypothetical protein [Acidobacteriota bacterium]